MTLVLSLFPGADLLGMAFEQEGFTVVTGPDVMFGRDIRNFHPPAGRFDGIIGGPPCQRFSRLRFLVEHNHHRVADNLIPEFERCVAEAQPRWWLMENVLAAPIPYVKGYWTDTVTVADYWCGGETKRRRAFSFGTRLDDHAVRPRLVPDYSALCRPDPAPTVCASGGAPDGIAPSARHRATRKGASAMGYKTAAYLRVALRDQGLPPDWLAGAPFTVAGKIKLVGNGVPMAMGRAVARAVAAATLAHERFEELRP